MRSIYFLQITCIIAALGCSSQSSDGDQTSGGSSSGGVNNGNAGNTGGIDFPPQSKGGTSNGEGGAATTLDGGAEAGATQDGGVTDAGGSAGSTSNGGGGAGGHAQDTDGGTDPGPDTTAPSIESVTPADDASGVHDDVEIVIEFSEPMNTTSVETAFDPGNLPNFSFSWNGDDSTMTVTPDAPLDYAEGFDTAVNAESYSFGIGDGAEDVAGNALPEASYSFTTLRRIAATLTGVAALDGFAQADGFDDHSYDEELVVGSTDDVKIAGLLTIDISDLPADIAEFESALLNVTQTTTYASYGAYDDLGDLYLEHVQFSAVNAAAVTAAALRNLGVIATTPANEVKHRSVTVALAEDYAQRVSRSNRSQYRLAFQTVGAADAGYVVTGFTTAEAASNAPAVEVTYLIP